MLPSITTDAALYDYLREKFGIGDYDDGAGVPYWRARNTEIAKLRTTMKRRRISIEEMLIAAWFAEHAVRPITAVYQLCQIVGEAKRVYRTFLAATTDPLREQLNAAASFAYDNGQFDWADRLATADLSTGAEVLDNWAKAWSRAGGGS